MAVSALSEVTIASIGSLNVDLIAFCNHFPSPGETLIGNTFEMGPGGKGANQCACAALLSTPSTTTTTTTTTSSSTPSTLSTTPTLSSLHRVAMIGAVGDDLFGSNYLKSFSSSNVIIDLIEIIPNISTGVAPITVDIKGENSIIVVPGANNKMTIQDTITKLEKLPNLICSLFQMEIPSHVTLACMKKCYERGIITFFTPAPVPPTGLSDDFFKYSSIVIPNLIEALQLSSGGGNYTTSERDDNEQGVYKDEDTRIDTKLYSINQQKALSAAFVILKKGAKAVCVTLGKEGVVLVMNNTSSSSSSDTNTLNNSNINPMILTISAPKVSKVIDTTGAGDAFSGSFAYFYAYLYKNKTMKNTTAISSDEQVTNVELDWNVVVQAAKRAVYIASLTVMKKGTQSSYVKREEVSHELWFNEMWDIPETI
jgi:sugar/nucleoside kinase (ribokinase family)